MATTTTIQFNIRKVSSANAKHIENVPALNVHVLKRFTTANAGQSITELMGKMGTTYERQTNAFVMSAPTAVADWATENLTGTVVTTKVPTTGVTYELELVASTAPTIAKASQKAKTMYKAKIVLKNGTAEYENTETNTEEMKTAANQAFHAANLCVLRINRATDAVGAPLNFYFADLDLLPGRNPHVDAFANLQNITLGSGSSVKIKWDHDMLKELGLCFDCKKKHEMGGYPDTNVCICARKNKRKAPGANSSYLDTLMGAN